MQESYTGGGAKTVVGSKAYCNPTQSRGPLKGPRALPSKGAVRACHAAVGVSKCAHSLYTKNL